MSSENSTPFMGFLGRHDQDAWWSTVHNLAPSIHEVDRDAVKIWFHFWPLWLRKLFEDAEANPQLFEELEFKGNARLEEHIDSSHAFVYGHRHWPRIKAAVGEHASSKTAPESLDLADQIRTIARQVAGTAKVDVSLLLGITAIGLMTLRQVGPKAFDGAEGKLYISNWARRRSPQKIIADRARNDGGGILGYLKGLKRDYTIRFNEGFKSATFKLIEGVQLTQASMSDQADHPYADSRCEPGDGPLPTQCRSAACGTCWVGVLGGNDRLSAVNPLERRRIARFGYINTDESRPLIRLACKAQATGNVTIVIPTWNAVAGRYLEGKRIAIGGYASRLGERTVAKPRRH
ncbi:MAG: (2Fe-2S)-binding protein [Acidobacteria bacterium]|nr:(2Fe-2S)-binding protein [Acidobacteriota bacterium]